MSQYIQIAQYHSHSWNPLTTENSNILANKSSAKPSKNMRHAKYIWLHLWSHSQHCPLHVIKITSEWERKSKCKKILCEILYPKRWKKNIYRMSDERNTCSHHHITINMVNLNVKWTFIFAVSCIFFFIFCSRFSTVSLSLEFFFFSSPNVLQCVRLAVL